MKALINDHHFQSLAGTIIASALLAIAVMLLAHTLTKEDFGVWIFFFSGAQLIDVAKYGLINHGMIKYLSQEKSIANKYPIVGTAWLLSLLVTLLLVLLPYAVYRVVEPNSDTIKYFLLGIPFYTLLSAPVSLGLSYMTALGKFANVFFIKLIFGVLFLSGILLSIFLDATQGIDIIKVQLIAMLIASVIVALLGWAGLQHVFRSSRALIAKLLRFGRYSILTFLGTNLLRSSDVFIIGILMTRPDVALYAVPLKLIEIIDIILNSIADVALPALSKLSADKARVASLFSKYVVASIALFLPMAIILFITASPLVGIFAGSKYLESGISVPILQIFLLCFPLMIIDRFSGITLDAIGKPNLSFMKVAIMVIINIVGDALVIHYFNRLDYVAYITVANVFFGMIVGLFLLKRELDLSVLKIVPNGFQRLRNEHLVLYR